MSKLTDWEAKRSSAGITITGKDILGNQVKLAGCQKIVAGAPHPTVIAKSGDRYQLA